MIGTTRSALYVNGVLKVTATDATVHRRRQGRDHGRRPTRSAPAKSNTTGIHFDNFQVTPSTYPRAADSKGTNTGDYKNGVTLGAAGALAGDTNTAATVRRRQRPRPDDQHHRHSRSAPRSARPSCGSRPRARPGRCCSATGSGANTQEYGLWIDAGGTTMTAWGFGGGNDKMFTMPQRGQQRRLAPRRQDLQRHHRSRCTSTASRCPRRPPPAPPSWTRTASASARSSAPPTATPVASSTARSTRSPSTRRSLSQATVTNHYQLGTAGAVDLDRPDRRLGGCQRPGRHRVALLDVDDAEHRAHQGHRPERRRRHGQPGAPRHRDPDRTDTLRHLRQLHA